MPTDFKRTKRGVGLGVFDGCHNGHAELIFALVERSTDLGIIPSVYTFRKHPSSITGNTDRIADGILTDDGERDKLLRERGVEEIIYQDFTEEFSQCGPEEFLDEYILGACNSALIVAGYNFRFGKNRSGDTSFLIEWGKAKGVEVIIVDPVMYRGEPVSSSSIRKAVRDGKLDLANAMLGRKFRLSGIIIPGQGLGKKLGFPTANFFPAEGMCIPGNGVYSTRLYYDGKAYDSVTNIGLRPSVKGKTNTPIVETMILEGEIDLYDQKIDVDFVSKLRDEQKFESIDELGSAIGSDVSKARLFHAGSMDPHEIFSKGQVKLVGLKTGRFTTDILTVSITLPIDARSASEYKLLSRVMTATCRKYPSRNLLINKMNSLYGAVISCNTSKTGDALSVEFSADALHSWHGDDYSFEDAAGLLFDVIGDPDFDSSGLFRQDIVEAEKTGLITEIKARENDKMKYSLDKAMGIYTEGTVYSARAFGDVSILQEINGKDLREAYDRLIGRGAVISGIAGKFDRSLTDRIAEMLSNVFVGNDPEKRIVPGLFPHNYRRKGTNIVSSEVRDVEQAKVCLICENIGDTYSPQNSEAVLLNEILGGDVDSLLFKVVREDLGLAYSVFSFNISTMNAIVMMAGVASENSDKAFSAMETQLERMQNGDYPDSLIQSAKNSLRNSLLQSADSLKEMLNNVMNSEFKGRYTRSQDLIDEIERIGKDELCRRAGKYETAVKFRVVGKSGKKKTNRPG